MKQMTKKHGDDLVGVPERAFDVPPSALDPSGALSEDCCRPHWSVLPWQCRLPPIEREPWPNSHSIAHTLERPARRLAPLLLDYESQYYYSTALSDMPQCWRESAASLEMVNAPKPAHFGTLPRLRRSSHSHRIAGLAVSALASLTHPTTVSCLCSDILVILLV
jgi:hypothetical protein